MNNSLLDYLEAIFFTILFSFAVWFNLFYFTKKRFNEEGSFFNFLGGITHNLPDPIGYWITKTFWAGCSIAVLIINIYTIFVLLFG